MGHLVRGRRGPLSRVGGDSAGEMAALALAYCVIEDNADHYQVSLVCWCSRELGFRWAGGVRPLAQQHVRGRNGGRPGDAASSQLDRASGGPRARWRGPGSDAVARTGPIRRALGPFGAKSGGTLRLCPLAFMWPPELGRISIERQRSPVCNAKNANCSADSPTGLHGGHSRHYAAVKSHPLGVPATEGRPGACLSRALP